MKKLFEGVRTDKLVKPVNKLLQLFDKNTSAGKGLAKIIESIMNPLIDGIVEALPLAKEFFKGMILGALKLIIIVLKLRNAILRAIPKETREKIMNTVESMLSLANVAKAGEVAFFALAIALGLVAVAGLLLVAVIVILIALLLAIPIAVGVVTAWLLGAFDKTGDKWEKDGKKASKGLIGGIVDGIKSGAGAIGTAMASLASGAVAAFKSALSSKSPSRVFFKVAETGIGGGVVKGLEAATPAVMRASTSMADAASEGARTTSDSPGEPFAPVTAARGGGAGNGGGGTVTVTIEDGAVRIDAPTGDAEDIATAVRNALQETLDNLALQLGGGEVAEAT